MDTIEFDNNDTMQSIGLGTWKAKDDEVKHAVKAALAIGVRHIDTAAGYFNEEEIGEVLTATFAEGQIKREDVFITSKLWNDAHQKGRVIPALKDSLKKLKLEYLDLYLMHWPVAFKPGVFQPDGAEDYLTPEEAPIIETWRQMEESKKQGLVKHIGVSNFSKEKLQDLIEKAEQKPEMNQVELHPFLQQKELLEYCNSQGIKMTAYSPLGSGDRPEEMKGEDEPNLMEIDIINDIAKKQGATPVQVLLKWHIKRGAAVIPKSTSNDHIKSNFEAAEVTLDREDMDKIASLDRGYRFMTGKAFEEPSKGYKNIYDE